MDHDISPAGTPVQRRFSVIAEAGHAGQRLDVVLAGALSGFSRTRLQALIRGGSVTRNGGPVTEPGAKVAAGDHYEVSEPPAASAVPAPQAIPLHVVYEDGDLIVIDKPAGLVVHPGAGHWDGTLVNALLAHCGASLSGIGGVERPGIVHRIDKDTSGLLVVAKNDSAHRGLQEQFADHGRTGPLDRAYLALVWGEPGRPRGTVDTPLDRDPRNREKMAVARQGHGRYAITHWERLESFGPQPAPVASMLRCRLETGRTHQIRVHLSHIGHPLLGDDVYGAGFRSKSARLPPAAQAALADLGSRQALHAARLAFEHPRTGETLAFDSPLPADLAHLVEALRLG